LNLIISYINGTKGTKGAIFFGFFGDSTIKDLTESQAAALNQILPVHLNSTYSSSTNDSTSTDYKIQINQVSNINDDSKIMVKDIPWTSCPAISFRTLTISKEEASVIITNADGTFTILAEWTIELGNRVMFFSPIITDYNRPFTLWPYFNYMIYVSALHCDSKKTDNDILSFQKWPHSPIPHTTEIIGWFTMVVGIWVFSFAVFFKMKKITKKHPAYQNNKSEISSAQKGGLHNE
jgi:hypothetical protein